MSQVTESRRPTPMKFALEGGDEQSILGARVWVESRESGEAVEGIVEDWDMSQNTLTILLVPRNPGARHRISLNNKRFRALVTLARTNNTSIRAQVNRILDAALDLHE